MYFIFIIYIFLKGVTYLFYAKSEDPNLTPRFAASDLSLQRLPISFWSTPIYGTLCINGLLKTGIFLHFHRLSHR